VAKIFTHRDLKETLGEQKTKLLVDDFRAYKDGKGLPATFGRDVPYDYTHNRSHLELQHLHFSESCTFSSPVNPEKTRTAKRLLGTSLSVTAEFRGVGKVAIEYSLGIENCTRQRLL
jgi:hypothetical protein